jgi:hypothetical protein
LQLAGSRSVATRARLARGVNGREDGRVIWFLLLPEMPWVLVLALAVVLWLTVVELLEWRPHYLWWFWWLFLVFLTSFVGYLFLRAYRVYQRWNAPRTG